jgi:glyoxylase-like metal-dependent hydrolase (beta-lactamase superfamily II)
VDTTWHVGDVSVSSLLDGVVAMPPSVLYPHVPLSTWAEIPGALNAGALLEVPFGGFLVRDGAGHAVLFDLGAGPDPDLLGNGELPPVRALLPMALEALGCPLDSVTDVVLSHLHIDHVGWASVDGVPTFSGARHHVHARDWDHFVEQGADEAVRCKVDPLRDVVSLWEGDQVSPFPWLRLFHAPGHTPGTSVAMVESSGESLALVGDLLHHPAAVANPHWHCGFDLDPGTAAACRAAWIDRLRAAGTPLVGPHFPGLTPVLPEGQSWVR